MSWNIIPQIFYDLIGRVIPGAIVLMIGCLTLLGPTHAINTILTVSSKYNIVNFGMSILGLILSYCLGFILGGLWDLTCTGIHDKWTSKTKAKFKVSKRSLQKLKKQGIPDKVIQELASLSKEIGNITEEDRFLNIVEKQIGKEQLAIYQKIILKHIEKQSDPIQSAIRYHNRIRTIAKIPPFSYSKDDLPPVHIMLDHLRLLSEPEGYRLLKLRAEQRMGRAMSMGFFLLAILNIGCWFNDMKFFIIDRAFVEIFLFLGIWSFWQKSAELENYYIHGVCTQWLLFNYPIKLQETKDLEKDLGCSRGN